jgi:hypothetical protein
MAGEIALTLAAFGLGWWVCAMRLNLITRRERERARDYYRAVRSVARRARTLSQSAIPQIAYVVGRRIERLYGSRLSHLEVRLGELREDLTLSSAPGSILSCPSCSAAEPVIGEERDFVPLMDPIQEPIHAPSS